MTPSAAAPFHWFCFITCWLMSVATMVCLGPPIRAGVM